MKKATSKYEKSVEWFKLLEYQSFASLYEEYTEADAHVVYKYDKTLEYSHSSDTSRIEIKMLVKVPRTQEVRYTPGLR